MSFNVYVNSIGLIGAGFNHWDEFILNPAITTACEPEINLPQTTALPATERRRLTSTIKLALACGFQAVEHLPYSVKNSPSVFATSNGDSEIMVYLAQTLSTDPATVSPTKFHNSLHNTASGYWSIAANTLQAATAIAAGDYTFAAGFIEASVQCLTEQKTTLLIAYDLKNPEALKPHLNIQTSFAVALLLAPEISANSKYKIEINFTEQQNDNASHLDELVTLNPILASIPLLQTLASLKHSAAIFLPCAANQSLQLRVTRL